MRAAQKNDSGLRKMRAVIATTKNNNEDNKMRAMSAINKKLCHGAIFESERTKR